MRTIVVNAIIGALSIGYSIMCLADANGPKYHIEVKDVPHEEHFVVTLVSNDECDLCLDVENWPNKYGQLHMGSNLVKLETASETYPAHDSNFGYCPGGCGTIRVPPKAALKGFIAYKTFGPPAIIKKAEGKKIHLSISPRFCDGNASKKENLGSDWTVLKFPDTEERVR